MKRRRNKASHENDACWPLGRIGQIFEIIHSEKIRHSVDGSDYPNGFNLPRTAFIRNGLVGGLRVLCHTNPFEVDETESGGHVKGRHAQKKVLTFCPALRDLHVNRARPEGATLNEQMRACRSPKASRFAGFTWRTDAGSTGLGARCILLHRFKRATSGTDGKKTSARRRGEPARLIPRILLKSAEAPVFYS